jgi:hypothetical protein
MPSKADLDAELRGERNAHCRTRAEEIAQRSGWVS